MARPLRIEYEGALYHVTSRGNAGGDVFVDDDDRRAFVAALAETVVRFGWLCHAYCLMSNHVHLLIETPQANLARGMHYLNGTYTQRFNRSHRRHGHLLQGRYKAILVERDSHLLELARYIALNPVRAKMVRSAKDWPWSSYRATAGQIEAPSFLCVDGVLASFDARRDRAAHAYRRFVQQGRGVNAWQGLRAGSLLGSDEFVERMRPRLLVAPLDPNVLRRERDAARPSLAEIFRGADDRTARNACIHTAVRIHHYRLQEVGEYLGLHFSTVSVIAKQQAARAQEKHSDSQRGSKIKL